MAHPFRPFAGACDNEPLNVLPAIASVEVAVALSGVIVQSVAQSSTCTPDPRLYTLTLSGSGSKTWTRQQAHGPSGSVDTDKFLLSRFACSLPGTVGFGIHGPQTEIAGGNYTCTAPVVTCITPPSVIPAVSTSTNIDLELSVGIGYNSMTGTYDLFLLCDTTPSIGCSGGSISEFLKLLTGLSLAGAFTSRSETVNVALGSGNLTCDFDLTFS